MNRLLLSGALGCPASCLYCFAKFEQPLDLTTIQNTDFQSTGIGAEIIYPCCDSEFSRSAAFIERLDIVAKSRSFTIFSLSTKRALSDDFLNNLSDLDHKMRRSNHGFIKLGVSFSTKSQCNEIEPRAASYRDRLKMLGQIKNSRIASSINIKPVLPFISQEEYIELVNDTLDLQIPYLVGGLYVSKKSSFFKQYIAGKYKTSERIVEWLPQKPSWHYVESEKTIEAIKKRVGARQGKVFDSDPELLMEISGNYKKNGI